MFRLILTIGIGYVLGWERKRKDKAGGSRTMGIVCMTSCLIAILTQKIALLNPDTHNFTRLMAYTIASIGFLGSGIIVQNKSKVEGLTTASSIWGIVPIGFCIGFGYYFYGILASILIYILLDSKYWKFKK